MAPPPVTSLLMTTPEAVFLGSPFSEMMTRTLWLRMERTSSRRVGVAPRSPAGLVAKSFGPDFVEVVAQAVRARQARRSERVIVGKAFGEGRKRAVNTAE